MTDIINFNKYRKQKARDDKKSRAQENIAKQGRNKQQKISDRQETIATTKRVDDHKISSHEAPKDIAPKNSKTGLIIGLARRAQRRDPMELIDHGVISPKAGLEGDFKGSKHATRQISILSIEDWQAALADIADKPELDWTVRRANILCQGIRLPRVKGARLKIGEIVLEVTGQTSPCARMDEAHQGLLKALHPNWRGGVLCRVIQGGPISLQDAITILSSPPEIVRKLP